MEKTVTIDQAVLDTVLSYAQMIHPQEAILLLRGKVDKKRIMVNDTQIPPLATHGNTFSSFPVHMLPIDFSIIGVAIASSFMTGMRIWGRVSEEDFSFNFMLLELERIAQALRQRVTIPSVEFVGDQQKLSFASISDDTVYFVTYEFDSLNNSLWSKRLKMNDILNEKDEGLMVKSKMFSADNIVFSYLIYNFIKVLILYFILLY